MNATCTVRIVDISQDGCGVAKPDADKVLFVTGALPGQVVRVAIDQHKERYAKAHVLEVLEEEGLEDPLCSSPLCGGCPLQRLPYAAQCHYKENILRQALLRLGHLDANHIDAILAPMTKSPATRHFRNKIEFAFGFEEKRWRLGFRAAKQHTVIEPDHCLLMPEPVATLRAFVADWVNQDPTPAPFWRHLIVRIGQSLQGERSYWLILITRKAKAAQTRQIAHLAQTLFATFPDIRGFIHEERSSNDLWAFGEHRRQSFIPSHTEFTLPLGGKCFALDPMSFFQVNLGAAERLLEQARALFVPFASASSLLDLYAGVGAPGLLLAHPTQRIVSVEAHKASVAFAAKNAQSFGFTHYEAHAGTSETVLPRILDALPKDCVAIVDPPRAGIDPASLALLRKRAFPGLLLISCNPQTLARDLAQLTTSYTVTAIQPVDLFPHTAHLESIALLVPNQERLV